MKRIFLFLFLLSMVSTLPAQRKWVEDPNIELRPLNGTFREIRVSGGIQLYLSQSDEQAVAVSAENPGHTAGIRTVLEGEVLKIYYENESGRYVRGKKLRAYVSFTELNMIHGSGAVNIRAEGTIRSGNLAIRMSGASDFSGAVNAGILSMDLSGASDVRIEGKADSLQVVGSGASDVKGYGLSARDCTVKVSGASDVQVSVTGNLRAHASGASSVRYRGEGVLSDVHSSGASTVERKD